MAGSAADRAARPDAAFEALRRVLAMDLPSPPLLADGSEELERSERAALLKALVAALLPLVMAVAHAEDAWRDATAREVRLRDGRETRREWLRLVLRAWREETDGRRAGAARWATKWREGRVGALAQREVDGVEWQAEQYSTLVLEYARLVRAGVIAAARQTAGTHAMAVAAAMRFAQGVKREWASIQGEDHEASLVSWAEGEGTRTLQRGDVQIVAVFATHGPPGAEHSAASAAKTRTAAGERRRAEQSGQSGVGTKRAVGKRPVTTRDTGSEDQSKRRSGSSSGQSEQDAQQSTRTRHDAVNACAREQPRAMATHDMTARQIGSGSQGRRDSRQENAASGDRDTRGTAVEQQRSDSEAGSSAAHAAVAQQGDAETNDAVQCGRAARKRRRAAGVNAGIAVEHFVAFIAGARVNDVTMVGGVHVLVGTKRTMVAVNDRDVRQRGERHERYERREKQQAAAARMEPKAKQMRKADMSEEKNRDCTTGATNLRDSDDEDESGGAGGWGAGGLGDRTGVG